MAGEAHSELASANAGPLLVIAGADWTGGQARMKSLPGVSEQDYIFPGANPPDPQSNNAMLALLERMKRDDITVHGFRSTFRDWAAEETNFPNHVVKMAMAHTIKSKVEGAYRRGELLEKRRALMIAWAGFCDKVRSGNVVSISQKTKQRSSRA